MFTFIKDLFVPAFHLGADQRKGVTRTVLGISIVLVAAITMAAIYAASTLVGTDSPFWDAVIRRGTAVLSGGESV